MTKKLLAVITCLIILLLGFAIGHDWPYFWPPDDFGTYTMDKNYKYVIAQDETRLCRLVCILDGNNQVLYHTNGYMNLGWHLGVHSLDVYWARDSYDLFVCDGRSTVDVYIYTGTAWSGPYCIWRTEDAGFVLMPPPYEYDFMDEKYTELPMPYPREQIPEELLSRFELPAYLYSEQIKK